MKSFSEYLKEAVDFRLGGCQKKGFDQSKVKSFRDLEKGDVFYFWNKNMGETARERCFSYKIEGPTYSNLYYDSNGGEFTVIHTKQLDDSFALPSKTSIDAGSVWCEATSFEELKELVKETFKIDVKNFIRK